MTFTMKALDCDPKKSFTVKALDCDLKTLIYTNPQAAHLGDTGLSTEKETDSHTSNAS